MKISEDAIEILHNDGAAELVRRTVVKLYRDFIRPVLPKEERTVVFNGIKVCTRDVCRFDKYALWFDEPWYTRDNPNYEEPLLEAIQSTAKAEDRVVIIGGGWGVSAVMAAKQVGESGKVSVYEGALERIHDINGTLELSGVRDRVKLKHAVVGEPTHLTGSSDGAVTLDPKDIPACDVLEMDCEGAETSIIPNLRHYPPALIVETHRNEDVVKNQLSDAGYDIVKRGVEKENEIFILTAKQRRTKEN